MCVLIITGKQDIYPMFESTEVLLLASGKNKFIYLARMPWISRSFFHIVAVLLGHPSDFCSGSVWISAASVKRRLGCVPKRRDSSESWPSPRSEEPGSRAFVGQALSLASPGSSSAGGSRWLSLYCGKGNSLLILVFAIFLIPWGVRGENVPEWSWAHSGWDRFAAFTELFQKRSSPPAFPFFPVCPYPVCPQRLRSWT